MALYFKCPGCGVVGKVHKYGKKWSGYHKLQMYQCNACGKVFSERQLETKRQPSIKAKESVKLEVGANLVPIVRKGVCPDCGGPLMKAGLDKTNPTQPIQRWKCGNCNKRTVNPKSEGEE